MRGSPARSRRSTTSAGGLGRVIRINLRGIFLVQRAALRAMIQTKVRGAVVNMASSMAGWDVLAGGAGYAASKHGVLGSPGSRRSTSPALASG